jgi:N-acetylglucosamine-6-phosphate deacetylase
MSERAFLFYNLVMTKIKFAGMEKSDETFATFENGRIVSEKNDAGSDTQTVSGNAYAGFIDIHNHGAAGVDVNTASADDLRKCSKFLASQGVTAWLPTFVPDSIENYQKVIAAIDEVMQTQDAETGEPAARILGVHYEGVFANEQMCGALRTKYFRTFANGTELDEIPTLKTEGAIHLTTLAPEIEGGIALIKEMKKRGWIVSIGHTRADVETLEQAKQAGATHVTHLFNAMTGVHHRDIGVAGWALSDREIFCEIIADGIHVHPEMLKFAYRNKTAEKLALVSDSVMMAGMGDGVYDLWDEKIAVEKGKTRNEKGGIAGSVITMLDAFQVMVSQGIAPDEVSKMASLVPAKILGVEKDYGSLEDGKRADIIWLDEQGNVVRTIIGGR